MSQGETTIGKGTAIREGGAPRGRYAIESAPGNAMHAVVEVQKNYEQALLDNGSKLATPEAYAYYQRFPVAPLWVVVALLCFADPRHWSVEQMRKVLVCRDRLRMAIREVRSNQRKGQGAPGPISYEHTRVSLEWGRRWAMQMLLPVPPLFPVHGSLQARELEKPKVVEVATKAPARDSPPRAPAKTKRDKPDKLLFLREADLLPMLPFSKATLWRRIKEERFPQPVHPSPGVTAWIRADIDKWLEEHSSPVAPQAAGKRSRRKT